jgi:glycine oxidase
MSRLVVIGGGVIGCAAAERLSRDGHQVTLLERDQLASKASGAAAGELSPSSLATDHQSLAMFPELVARIEKDSGMNVEYRLQQGLKPAFTEAEAATLRAESGRWLDATECRQTEPALTHELVGALLLEHAHLTPPRFVRALARAAYAHGAEVREGTPATGFVVEGREVRQVKTPVGAIAADACVIAAGPWTREVAAHADVDVDVRPQRGQLAALDPGWLVLRRSVFWSSGYLVPKGDGTVIAGGTEEDAGFDDRPTVAGIAALLDLARKLMPDLAQANLQRVWAGLRPVMRDGAPVVARSEVSNLVVATGHHRKGILLAPLAAEQLSQILKK